MEKHEGRATDNVLVELCELSDNIQRFVTRSKDFKTMANEDLHKKTA